MVRGLGSTGATTKTSAKTDNIFSQILDEQKTRKTDAKKEAMLKELFGGKSFDELNDKQKSQFLDYQIAMMQREGEESPQELAEKKAEEIQDQFWNRLFKVKDFDEKPRSYFA